MYDSAEVNQLIVVIPAKEVMFNQGHNELYYHYLEDHDLVIVNTVEQTQDVLSRRELSGTR